MHAQCSKREREKDKKEKIVERRNAEPINLATNLNLNFNSNSSPFFALMNTFSLRLIRFISMILRLSNSNFYRSLNFFLLCKNVHLHHYKPIFRHYIPLHIDGVYSFLLLFRCRGLIIVSSSKHFMLQTVVECIFFSFFFIIFKYIVLLSFFSGVTCRQLFLNK